MALVTSWCSSNWACMISVSVYSIDILVLLSFSTYSSYYLINENPSTTASGIPCDPSDFLAFKLLISFRTFSSTSFMISSLNCLILLLDLDCWETDWVAAASVKVINFDVFPEGWGVGSVRWSWDLNSCLRCSISVYSGHSSSCSLASGRTEMVRYFGIFVLMTSSPDYIWVFCRIFAAKFTRFYSNCSLLFALISAISNCSFEVFDLLIVATTSFLRSSNNLGRCWFTTY